MKARARQIIAKSSRSPEWVPDYARGDAELWTPRLVRDVLVDAFRMLRRIGGRVGPARLRAYWPEFRIDQADFVEQMLAGNLKQSQPPKAAYRTRINATRMEMVMIGAGGLPPWMDMLREAPDLQRVLHTWIKAELRGDAIKELCRDKGMVYTTFLTHRDRAAGIIAQRLNAAGVDVW